MAGREEADCRMATSRQHPPAGIIHISILESFGKTLKNAGGVMNSNTNELYHQNVEKWSQKARWRVYALRVNPESIFRGRLWHKTLPNPRRSVRPSGVDRAWEILSEHERQFVVSRSPFVPPFPLPHHHRLPALRQEHRIFPNFSLLEVHGPHQGKK